jgi:hypothetical protein
MRREDLPCLRMRVPGCDSGGGASFASQQKENQIGFIYCDSSIVEYREA